MNLVPYHTGIIVDDVGEAVPRWAAMTGVPWGGVFRGPVRVRTVADNETTTHQVTSAYSLDLRLELVQLVPGSCWTVDGKPGIHHVGCWSEDIAADAARLQEEGWPVVAHGVADDGALAGFSYHQTPDGVLLELVTVQARALLNPSSGDK
jgi:hypothetical protein